MALIIGLIVATIIWNLGMGILNAVAGIVSHNDKWKRIREELAREDAKKN